MDSEHEYQEVPTLAATAPAKNHLEKKQEEEEIRQVRLFGTMNIRQERKVDLQITFFDMAEITVSGVSLPTLGQWRRFVLIIRLTPSFLFTFSRTKNVSILEERKKIPWP